MCKMILNNNLNGVELYFENKPSADVLLNLKNGGFRWSNFKKCWYAKQKEATLQLANKYASEDQPITETISQNTYSKKTITHKPKAKAKNELLPLWQRVQFEKVDNYTPELTNKEIAAIFRKHLRTQFPEVKFSVTIKGYNSINIYIVSSPYCYKKLEYDPKIEHYKYREYEQENNKELLAILEYCNNLHNSYNYDNSDAMTDYFDVNYYGSCSIDYDYKQTEQTEEHKKIITEFRNKLKDEAQKEQERREKEFQEYLKQQEIYKVEEAKRQEEEKKQLQIINNNVDVKEIKEVDQYFIINSEFADINKMQTLEECKKQVLDGDFYLNNVKITREIHFQTLEALQYFQENLLTDFDFLANSGGSYTDDPRIQTITDYNNMTKEEQETVIFNLYGVAVYYNNKIQFVIDTQGCKYSRYVGLTDNATIIKDYNAEKTQTKDNKELETLKQQAETLADFSTEVITENNLYNVWNSEKWNEYKFLLKDKLKYNGFKPTRAIIQQLTKDQDSLKVEMYRLLVEVEGVQEQFKEANLQQGQKITIFKISDFGMMTESRITIEKVEDSQYAQYNNVVKLTFTPQGKRKQYYNYYYNNMIVFDGWVELPKTALYNTEETKDFTITKSKYLSCDDRQYDEILSYFEGQGIKPIVNTYKPQF